MTERDINNPRGCRLIPKILVNMFTSFSPTGETGSLRTAARLPLIRSEQGWPTPPLPVSGRLDVINLSEGGTMLHTTLDLTGIRIIFR